MKEEDKIHVADERMKKFFTQLLELKSWLKKGADASKDKVMHEVHEKLDKIIKEGK
jgi:hypothetical protein